MNLVFLTGRLTRSPELNHSNSGTAYCRFSLAVDRPFKKGEADFINCVAFSKTAELISKYLDKGSKIGLEGTLTQNRYESNGEKKSTYEVIAKQVEFLESKKQEMGEFQKKVSDAFTKDDEFPY